MPRVRKLIVYTSTCGARPTSLFHKSLSVGGEVNAGTTSPSTSSVMPTEKMPSEMPEIRAGSVPERSARRRIGPRGIFTCGNDEASAARGRDLLRDAGRAAGMVRGQPRDRRRAVARVSPQAVGPTFCHMAGGRRPGAVLRLDRQRALPAKRRHVSAAHNAATQRQRVERGEHQALPGPRDAGPGPPQRSSRVRQAGRGAVANLLVREPSTRIRCRVRGGVQKGEERVGLLRGAGPFLLPDGVLLGHEREARRDADAPAREADRVLAGRREAGAVCFAFAATSFSLTRALTRALSFDMGSGLSSGNLSVDRSVRYCSSPLASPAG